MVLRIGNKPTQKLMPASEETHAIEEGTNQSNTSWPIKTPGENFRLRCNGLLYRLSYNISWKQHDNYWSCRAKTKGVGTFKPTAYDKD